MVNPFRGPPTNPDAPDEVIVSHEALWAAVRKLRIGQARLEVRAQYNWLLGVFIVGTQVAIFLAMAT